MRFDDDASAQQALMTGQADLSGGGLLVPGTLNKMKPDKATSARSCSTSCTCRWPSRRAMPTCCNT